MMLRETGLHHTDTFLMECSEWNAEVIFLVRISGPDLAAGPTHASAQRVNQIAIGDPQSLKRQFSKVFTQAEQFLKNPLVKRRAQT
jgi:hypothetical protein